MRVRESRELKSKWVPRSRVPGTIEQRLGTVIYVRFLPSDVNTAGSVNSLACYFALLVVVQVCREYPHMKADM